LAKSSEELKDLAAKSHADSLRVVDALLEMVRQKTAAIPRELTPDMSIDEIIDATIGTVHNKIKGDIDVLADLSKKLTKPSDLDDLLAKLKVDYVEEENSEY